MHDCVQSKNDPSPTAQAQKRPLAETSDRSRTKGTRAAGPHCKGNVSSLLRSDGLYLRLLWQAQMAPLPRVQTAVRDAG